MVTIADKLRAQGREEGKEEGIKSGIQIYIEKGKLEGKLEVARKMLTENILDINTVSKITGLPVPELKKLVH